MRAILSVLVALSVAGPGASQLLAQSDQAPVFRSGVEVMEVDVTVVDAKGMPVRDLRVPEFTVTIDGQPRRVVSAEFISDSTTPSGEPARPRDPYVSNNTDRRPGRLIMLVIDRNNIDTHTLRSAVASLKQFVSQHRARRPAVARHHSAAGPIGRFHHQPRADPRRHLAHRRVVTIRCCRGSTSATTRPSRSRIDRTPLSRSGCCFARAAIPIRTRCRRAIATSSRKH